MIKIEDDWYHFDVSHLSDSTSGSLVRTDRQMSTNYSWDIGSYPECTGNLDYTYLTNSGHTEPPTDTTDPENNETGTDDQTPTE